MTYELCVTSEQIKPAIYWEQCKLTLTDGVKDNDCSSSNAYQFQYDIVVSKVPLWPVTNVNSFNSRIYELYIKSSTNLIVHAYTLHF